jgi:hypothetical protein
MGGDPRTPDGLSTSPPPDPGQPQSRGFPTSRRCRRCPSTRRPVARSSSGQPCRSLGSARIGRDDAARPARPGAFDAGTRRDGFGVAKNGSRPKAPSTTTRCLPLPSAACRMARVAHVGLTFQILHSRQAQPHLVSHVPVFTRFVQLEHLRRWKLGRKACGLQTWEGMCRPHASHRQRYLEVMPPNSAGKCVDCTASRRMQSASA